MKKGNVLKKTAAMILALSLLFPAELQAAQINAADTQTGTAAAAEQEVAKKLNRVFGGKGILGRLGGDEFVVLSGHSMRQSEIKTTLERLREEIGKIRLDGLEVTCSVGVLPVEAGYTLEELYRYADRLLYMAKKKGKNQFVLGRRSTGAGG